MGNVTSQLFAHIDPHELDKLIKHQLSERYYLRYRDDSIFLSNDENHLKNLIISIQKFLIHHLRLELHPQGVAIRKLSQGIDFVGYIFFSKYRLIRTQTRKQMQKRLKAAYIADLKGSIDRLLIDQCLQSYLGILSHSTHARLSHVLINAYWVCNPS